MELIIVKMKKCLFTSLFVFLCGTYTIVCAQTDTSQVKRPSTKDCEPQAIGDLFKKKGKPQKPPRKTSVLVLPNVSSNPTNGFLLGVGGGFGWYMGPRETTRVSSAPFTAAVTSRSQLITFIKLFEFRI